MKTNKAPDLTDKEQIELDCFLDAVFSESSEGIAQSGIHGAIYRWMSVEVSNTAEGWTAVLRNGKPCDVSGLRLMQKIKETHKILWVCDSGIKAAIRKEQLGGNARFVGVGSMLAGRSFDEIILELSKKPNKQTRRWLKYSVGLSLYPGGVIRRLVNEKT